MVFLIAGNGRLPVYNGAEYHVVIHTDPFHNSGFYSSTDVGHSFNLNMLENVAGETIVAVFAEYCLGSNITST